MPKGTREPAARTPSQTSLAGFFCHRTMPSPQSMASASSRRGGGAGKLRNNSLFQALFSPCVLPNRDGTVWTLLHCQRGISLYFCKQYFCAAIHHRIMLSKPVISESLFFFFKPPKSSLELWFASSPQLKARNYHTESVARSFCLVLGGGTVPSLCSFRVTVRTP